jgi:hypothetical protein
MEAIHIRELICENHITAQQFAGANADGCNESVPPCGTGSVIDLGASRSRGILTLGGFELWIYEHIN